MNKTSLRKRLARQEASLLSGKLFKVLSGLEKPLFQPKAWSRMLKRLKAVSLAGAKA